MTEKGKQRLRFIFWALMSLAVVGLAFFFAWATQEINRARAIQHVERVG